MKKKRRGYKSPFSFHLRFNSPTVVSNTQNTIIQIAAVAPILGVFAHTLNISVSALKINPIKLIMFLLLLFFPSLEGQGYDTSDN